MSKELAVTKDLSKAEQVRQMIKRMKPGTIFFAERFPDIEKSVLRVILHRLVTEDFIERVAHGIYRKPKYSEFLEVRLFADADEVARAVAKKEKFKIDYHPAYASNALGFSQQVPPKSSIRDRWLFEKN